MKTLKRLFFLTLLLAVTFTSVLGFFWFQVQKLKSHYPVYDLQTKKYVLKKEKPKNWIGIDDVSKVARWAILVSEDWAFYQHQGLDLNQLEEALRESYQKRKFVRGASTITQQVVKNALLDSRKTIQRKLKEMVMATMLEKTLTKDQILEIYLNLIELGPELYGIKKASFFYFQKKPSLLNAKEGAFLAMLLPSPIRYSQSYRNQKLTPFAKDQIEDILIKLRQARVINEEQRQKERRRVLSFESTSYFGEDLFDINKEF